MPPAVVATCPYPDTLSARVAGDSVGRRASVAGHVVTGVLTGFVSGVALVPATGGESGAAKGVALASLIAMGSNVAVGASRTAPPKAARVAIADCDSATRAAFTSAFARRAQPRRARWALWSGLGFIAAGVAVLFALVIAALSNEIT